MQKLGGLSFSENLSLAKAQLTDTEIAMMMGKATALYLRFKSIEVVTIDFIKLHYIIYFKSLNFKVKDQNSIELLYEEVEKEIIKSAMDGYYERTKI